MGVLTVIVPAIAVVVSVGLRDRLGLGRAVACGLAAAMLSTSAAGLVLLDLEALTWGALCGCAIGWRCW
jgi:hypothetical protein